MWLTEGPLSLMETEGQYEGRTSKRRRRRTVCVFVLSVNSYSTRNRTCGNCTTTDESELPSRGRGARETDRNNTDVQWLLRSNSIERHRKSSAVTRRILYRKCMGSPTTYLTAYRFPQLMRRREDQTWPRRLSSTTWDPNNNLRLSTLVYITLTSVWQT